MNIPKSKKALRRWKRKYIKEFRYINKSMWDTDAMRGPTFRPSDIGDTEYVDSCWAEFRNQQEEYHQMDIHSFNETVHQMPPWLDAKELLYKALNHPVRGWLGHHRIPIID